MLRLAPFRRLSTLVVAVSLIASGVQLCYSNDVRNYPPILENDDEVLQYVAYIRRVIPEVFQPGGDYYVDPLAVVKREQALLKVLHSKEVQPVYQAELPKQRHPYQKLEVTIHESVPAIETRLNAQGAETLQKTFAALAHQYPDSKALDRAMVELFRSTGLGSQGLLTGLIQSLPADAKATAFKLPSEEKLEYVKQHLTNEDLKAKFRTTVYKPEEITVPHLLGEYQRLEDAEKKLGKMAMFREWRKAGASSKTSEDALSKLAIWNAERVQSSLEGLTADGLALDGKDAKRFRDVVQAATHAHLKGATEEVQGFAWRPKSTFTIEEVSPNIGIFRGCMNSDCSTAYAYGYPYSPSERTYLVRDETGKLLTAVYATAVEADGKSGLYIHDLGSPKLSASLSGDIFKAFYSAKDRLGFAHVLLTERDMHHSQFKKSVEAVASDAGKVPLSYSDSQTRNKIGDTLVEHIGPTRYGADYPKKYDLPEANQTARVFVPKTNDKERVELHLTQFQEPVFNAHPLSDSERTELFLDFLARDNMELSKAALKLDIAPEAKENVANEIKAALLNYERRPVKDHLKHLEQVMVSHGMHPDSSVLTGKAHSLAQGFLKSPDCWQGPDSSVSKQSMEFITQLAKENPADPLIKTVTEAHPEIVRTSAFEKLFRSFVKDNAFSMAKAEKLLPRFGVYPEYSPAVQDLLFQALEFNYSPTPPRFVVSALIKAEVQPTESQLEILARGMKKQMSRSTLMDLIDNLPGTWKEPVFDALTRCIEDQFIGERITIRLLAAGARAPRVKNQAKRWMERNPQGLVATWLAHDADSCVFKEIMSHLH